MNPLEDILKPEERVTLSLRGLYERHGYQKYRMGKFEEYGLHEPPRHALLPPRGEQEGEAGENAIDKNTGKTIQRLTMGPWM